MGESKISNGIGLDLFLIGRIPIFFLLRFQRRERQSERHEHRKHTMVKMGFHSRFSG